MDTNYDDLPAGRELDALVAERVMGAEPRRYAFATSDGGQSAAVWEDRHGAFTTRRDIEEWVRRHEGFAVREGIEYQPYSTDIAAAWQVVERVIPTLWLTLLTPFDGRDGFHASFTPVGKAAWSDRVATVVADTAPLAICRAALKAVAHG